MATHIEEIKVIGPVERTGDDPEFPAVMIAVKLEQENNARLLTVESAAALAESLLEAIGATDPALARETVENYAMTDSVAAFHALQKLAEALDTEEEQVDFAAGLHGVQLALEKTAIKK